MYTPTQGHGHNGTPGHCHTGTLGHCSALWHWFRPFLALFGRNGTIWLPWDRAEQAYVSCRCQCLWPSGRPVCLTKSALRSHIVLCKGWDWVESITKTHSYLLPELLRSLQPEAEMAALLLMSRRQIMQKLGENMTFRKSHEQKCCSLWKVIIFFLLEKTSAFVILPRKCHCVL